jgi:hypothetical protein
MGSKVQGSEVLGSKFRTDKGETIVFFSIKLAASATSGWAEHCNL